MQYGTLGVRLVGAGSVLAAVTFFAAGSAAQAFLVKSIARLVADQERMEGTLRAAHGAWCVMSCHVMPRHACGKGTHYLPVHPLPQCASGIEGRTWP